MDGQTSEGGLKLIYIYLTRLELPIFQTKYYIKIIALIVCIAIINIHYIYIRYMLVLAAFFKI